MPGVNVTTATRSGPVADNVAPSGQFFAAGMADRGSTLAPALVTSIADFESKFGERVSYSHLYDNIDVFFQEGGARAWVIRVVGPSATKGTITLVDRAAVPDDTLKFDAISGGAWSSGLTITVADLSATTELTVALDGTTVERFTGSTVAEIVEAFSTSSYVVCSSLGSSSTAPTNMPAEGTSTLSAGTDDRANVTATHYTTALELFGIGLGDGVVAVPGVGSTMHDALIAHAVDNRRIALLAEAETAAVATLKATAAALNSEYAGLFAPWVQISTAAGTRFTSPEGYVAAVRNRAHVEAGPWRAPAGQIAVAKSLIGLKYDYSRIEGDELDGAKVSAIRLINNTVRLYGWRSLSDDSSNYALIVGRDLLNRLVVQSEAVLEQYVFQSVDGKGQLLSAINGAIVGICQPIAQAGGLYPRYDAAGNLLDPGYRVDTSNNINTLESLSNNEVKAKVSVRMSPTASLISITIVKVGLLAGL